MQPPNDDHRETPGSEIIRPLRVKGNGRRDDHRPAGRYTLIIGAVFIGIVITLVGTGLWLFSHLAKNPVVVTRTPETPGAAEPGKIPDRITTQSDDQAVESAPPRMQGVQDAEFDRILGAFLKVKAELETKGVSRWGGSLYTRMNAMSSEADKLLLEKSFLAAAEKYTGAKTIADQLTDRMAETLQQSIEAGETALAAGDRRVARESFEVARLIAPDNPAVKRGLKRAENIDEVTRLAASGKDHENNGDFVSAARDYEQVLALDPDAKEAAAGLERIRRQAADRKFQQLMSQGLTALDKKDYATARAKLRQAGKIRPGSQVVGDALAQLDQAVRLAEIEKLRRRALESEASEDWEQALASYLQVIKLDPNLRFARQGRERSLNRVQIAKQIDYFLENPDVLGRDPQLEKAQALIDEAAGVTSRGPRLNERIHRLTALVKAAKTPVRVTIQSDNLTEVAVYRVGKLGRFTTRDLDLRPGSYTIVGARDGYQDIRQRITIKPGEKPLRVTVICRMKV